MITDERLREAVDYLSRHNCWRRGAEMEASDPRKLGEAIDTAIAALSELAELRAAREWHDGSTAPVDGTWFMAWFSGAELPTELRWNETDSRWEDGEMADGQTGCRYCTPFKWMPLPTPPKEAFFSVNALISQSLYRDELKEELSTIEAALTELEQLRKQSQWQPIGTAPRDGSYVLTFCNRFTNKLGRSGGGIMEAHYIKYQDCWDTHVWWNIKGEACYPTHWMPLPTPPKEDGNDH